MHPTRRTVLTGSAAAALTALATRAAGADPLPGSGATKIKDLSGPAQTGQFATPWSDLGIPARCPDGSMLFVGGDSFDGAGAPGTNWRSPVGLRSSSSNLASLTIDSAVGGSSAVGLVPEGHVPVGDGRTTAIPSDIFTIGNTMYLHLMRGVIYRTDHSDFWKSDDNGNTWTFLCQWPGDLLGGQFQQKTYAVADDGYCYVLSSVFNRKAVSGLLLHRVPHAEVGVPASYQPWGFANGAWAWGNPASTITTARGWGEICFRQLDGHFVFTFFNDADATIRAQVLSSALGNFFATREQTLITNGPVAAQGGTVVTSPYGGFVVPGSTIADFHIVVSQWYDSTNYRFMQYRINGLGV
ncbi:DUF4185 domain-containing protein [Flexivirga meconopsidis]|uniref:DUF4185 domain-containing protein n=1 Tax=Flexivirga meconopsidis TaxID=2977121 RepID=UPI00223FBCF0|nr:DUF4185 domain-containing protein [Flexivirga meconopsidis]